MKIIKIKDCVDCPYVSNSYHGYYCDYEKILFLIPESGIHPDCKLEDYRRAKK